MNTFDRHLLREWLSILGLVLAVTCGLLLAQVCYDDLRDLREAGARGWELWHYLLVTMPQFFAFVLPFAILFSLLFVLTKLHRANEITAMRVAGVGFPRLMAPVWAVGVLACGIVWWLNASIVPWSIESSRTLSENIAFREQAKTLPPDRVGALYSVAFENAPAGRVWFFNRYSRATRRGYGVSLSELDPQRRESARILAAEAWWDPVHGGWEFRRGRLLEFNTETGEQISSRPFTARTERHFGEDPQLMLLIGRRPIDLSFFELRRLIAYFAISRNPAGMPYVIEYDKLIAEILRPLIAIAVAIPFSVTGVRVNPAVGVSKSIGLFFLYYFLASLAGSLATKHLVQPEVAAWLPDVAMAGVAAWFFGKLR